MNISVYGAGYVGLVSAVCFANLGHHVCCTDIRTDHVEKLLKGICPIYEAELPELLKEQLDNGRLQFTDKAEKAILFGEVHFIATGTPSLADGSADLSQVFTAVEQIAMLANKPAVVVTKSTVPVGTGDKIESLINDVLVKKKKSIRLEVVSNPEFLREGTAVFDFLNADRIVVGGRAAALESLKTIYKPLIDSGIPFLTMSRSSAELTKYASNAMLACRISFMNQMSRLAERVGANIDEIKVGMGTDHRIGPYFLNAGIGYGGSCFPKDSRALIHTAKSFNIDSAMLEAIEHINEYQKQWAVEMLLEHFGHSVEKKRVAIWGLAFKPGTDDLREASSFVIINELTRLGVDVVLYDPKAMPAAKQQLADNHLIRWSSSAKEAIDASVDALIIATEWDEFKQYPLNEIESALGDGPLIDGRNCYALKDVASSEIGYYYSVGRMPIGRCVSP